MTKARWIEGATRISENSSHASKQEVNNTTIKAVMHMTVVINVKKRTVAKSVGNVQRKTAS